MITKLDIVKDAEKMFARLGRVTPDLLDARLKIDASLLKCIIGEAEQLASFLFFSSAPPIKSISRPMRMEAE
jgi:hypothetical protein